MHDDDEPRFDIATASALAGVTVARWNALTRAGARMTPAERKRGGRYVERDVREVAVIDAIAAEFDLKAKDAVAYWRDLTPNGDWPTGSKHILFELDGEPVARIYPGAIAARIARRIQFHDLEALRRAEADSSSSVRNGIGLRALVPPLGATQRFDNNFHKETA